MCDSSFMVRHVVDCLRNVVHCFRVIYSLFGKCCVNIIAFFRFLLRFLLCRPFAFPFAAFCVLPCASSSFCAPCLPPRSFAVALPLGRSLLKFVVLLRSCLRPFALYRVRPRPFAPPVCHLVLSPLRFRWADHCLNVSSFCAPSERIDRKSVV